MANETNYDLSDIEERLMVSEKFFFLGHPFSFRSLVLNSINFLTLVRTHKKSLAHQNYILFPSLQTKVSQCQERWCSRLCELWREMGLDQDTTSERIDSLSKHLDKIWGGIIEEEDGVKAQMTDIVDSVRGM